MHLQQDRQSEDKQVVEGGESTERYLFLKKYLLMLKVIIYFMSIVCVQHFVQRKFAQDSKRHPGTTPTASTHREVILIFEILIFYFSIMALMIFLLFSRFFSFRTIRERMEWGGNMRYKRDFLEFVQDDVHYVVIALSQFLLFVYVLKHLTHEIDWTVTLAIVFLCCRYAFSFAAIFYVYFYSKANGKKKKIKVLSYFLGTLITSGVMLFCFAQNLREKLYWWPFVLQDIVLNFFVLLNIIIEFVLLPKKV